MRSHRVGGRPVGARTLGRIAAGGVLIGVGAAAMIAAGLGVTPWDVLTTAVSERAGVTVGGGGRVAEHRRVRPVRPSAACPGGQRCCWSAWAAPSARAGVLGEPRRWLAGCCCAAGVPVVCFEVALIVRADIGVGPLEMVMLVATDRSVPLVRARVLIEVTTLTVGWALGGALGLGTAGFALAAGRLSRARCAWSARPNGAARERAG
jgi:uncharacterized membrane protein YczE